MADVPAISVARGFGHGDKSTEYRDHRSISIVFQSIVMAGAIGTVRPAPACPFSKTFHANLPVILKMALAGIGRASSDVRQRGFASTNAGINRGAWIPFF